MLRARPSPLGSGLVLGTCGLAALLLTIAILVAACTRREHATWERDNPVTPLPIPPLGVEADFTTLSFAVTPEKVRLGRWLFYDPRLSSDDTVSCATCHRPEHAFSEPTPHSIGVNGQVGTRKAPTFVNGAWPFSAVFFWDGRATSLIEQAQGPMENPLEMGMTHELVVTTVAGIPGYRRAFAQVYGDETIDIERVAEAIAAYEATRLSGNSPWDRYQDGDQSALSAAAALGAELFFDKAACATCHVGWNFTDSQFHNLGIGWDPVRRAFADSGRVKVTGEPADTGAFKTPTLREVTKHAPYMHDGSIPTLREAVEHYNRGGTPNPHLSPKIHPLGLTSAEVDALVAFMEALTGEGYQDRAPASFPR